MIKEKTLKSFGYVLCRKTMPATSRNCERMASSEEESEENHQRGFPVGQWLKFGIGTTQKASSNYF